MAQNVLLQHVEQAGGLDVCAIHRELHQVLLPLQHLNQSVRPFTDITDLLLIAATFFPDDLGPCTH